MKKKYVLITAIIVLLIIVASITNPSKDDFISWSKDKLKSESSNGLVNWGIEAFGDSIIGSATKTNNFVLFSIFTSKLSETEDVKILGVFDNFIPLSGSSKIVSSDATKSSEIKEEAKEPLTIPMLMKMTIFLFWTLKMKSQ